MLGFLALVSLLLIISMQQLYFVSSFQGASIPTTIRQSVERYKNQKQRSIRDRDDLIKRRFSAKTKNQVESKATKVRNIFHDYNKPLLLIGCSSTNGDELTKLAKSFLDKSGSSNINDNYKIIQLAANKDEILLQAIETDTLGWPNILILDIGDSLSENGSDSDVEPYYKDLCRKLYEDNGLLSIYVNVKPSTLKDTSAQRKERFEDDVFVTYSDYEICISDNDLNDITNWEHIEWEFLRLLARARLIPAVPGDKTRTENTAHLTMGLHTFFLSLSFPTIQQVEPYVEEMCKDVDAMEYRTDLLDCCDNRFDLLYGMQLLRKYCRPYVVRAPALPFGNIVIEDVMPIVYTVRTANQAGKYPDDDAGINKMFQLLEWGLRGGVEVLDVESAWDFSKTSNLLKHAEERYSSQILGSHHVVGKEIEIEDAVALFEQCALNGRAHGAKVVLSIESDEKDRMAYEAALIASELAEMDDEPVIPNISLILGDVGQFSRVINFPFTPVTHEALPVKAAPGQLTANEIMTTRIVTGLFRPKKFCILGCNIAYSVSPEMHGAAFAATKLPHEYFRVDVEKVEEFVESEFFTSDDFGGASVTIPHKQAIIPYIDHLSDAAKDIGSVNTISVQDEFVGDGFKRVTYGDNTDWRGIYNPLNRILGSSVNRETDYALILGAGGTARAAAYVAKKLGLNIIYYNRTPENAIPLTESFGGMVLESLNESSDSGKALGDFIGENAGRSLRVIISTLPAASKFTLPEWLISLNKVQPIVFDVNYKPYYTSLLRQAEDAKLTVVRGSEMLWEQGAGQFEIWTERSAPYSVMKEVVLKNCEE